MPIVIHWDWEGHSVSKPLQSSCTETLLAPRTALRAAAHAVQIFTVFIFEYGVSIRNIRKFAPFENFPLYVMTKDVKMVQKDLTKMIDCYMQGINLYFISEQISV